MRLVSSKESVIWGEPSWLAVAETFWAAVLGGWLVWQGAPHWSVWIPFVFAPLLLLRSPLSTEKGARWFAAYVADKTALTPFGTPFLYWFVFLPIILFGTGFLAASLAEQFLPYVGQWQLFFRVTLISLLSMWIAMALAVAGAMEGAVLIALLVAFSLAIGAARAGIVEVAFAWGLAVTLVGIVAAAITLMWLGAVAGEGELAIAILLAGVPWIIGIWLRSLLVRVVATLAHPWYGLRSLPGNWRRFLWILDLHHPPELVPDLLLWTKAFSIIEIKEILLAPGLLKRLFGVLAFVCFFLPAMLYRWGIKSTIWLYWPLLWLESGPFNRDVALREEWRCALCNGGWERMRRWLSWLVAGIMAALLVFSIPLPAQWLQPGWQSWSLWQGWQGGVLAALLLTEMIALSSRQAEWLEGLRLLVWLRNCCALWVWLLSVRAVAAIWSL
ncbi:hypothetical protein [Candidatus Magnetaquicoccus inordinatus]|uniref:hypothetical protein n=1 Tax=Candidatus Magnetaquicoccus inordinatus TaxID=2496818 RepID=UPI00102AFC9B|nr:hypothetical protein [Candidatus Magnetaquicoccus inordinatus]